MEWYDGLIKFIVGEHFFGSWKRVNRCIHRTRAGEISKSKIEKKKNE
jgi:hypothetical protein